MDWRTLRVSKEGTHHEADGASAYEARFDAVLAFHEPGLAPVRLGTGAWHITAKGKPAYAARFQQTFGFYDDRAAVIAQDDGWHHILPSGAAAYSARYAWCGNYQERLCAVRAADGRYFHIDLFGGRVSGRTWRYAGDFRDGVAVVQREDGRSSHIDARGELLHDRWFLDLDVFHKGFARARFDDGWVHVDRSGNGIYARRFAMVEPFYNGQARVERFDGALEIIDETGRMLRELRSPRRSEFASLSGDIVGYWRSQTICAAVESGIFDHLPANLDLIAGPCGFLPDRARRLLRALGELGLVEHNDGTWRCTERGKLLREGHPLSLAGAAVEFIRHLSRSWETLPAALEEGPSWTPSRVFDEVAQAPSRVARHSRMLRSYAVHDYADVPDVLNLRGDETVIDAGGGTGALAGLLLGRHPALRVVLLERPEVAQIASVETDRAARFRAVAADIFEPWPEGGDCVVLARVLHDWDDELCLRILRHARAALGKGGVLYVVEMLLEPGDFNGSLCDLHLLVNSGGAERTLDDYAALFGQCAFELRDVRRLDAVPSVLCAVAT